MHAGQAIGVAAGLSKAGDNNIGLQLTAGQDNIDVQAQHDVLKLMAKQDLKLVSVDMNVEAKRIRIATAGGASITLEGGNIAVECAGPILRDLADAACYACALSQIDTSLEIGQFADALTRRSEVLLPDGMSMLLRFFDTRILMPLLDVLTDDQRIAFLSCARDWWYADREGAMVPSLRPTWAGADTFAPPLKLSADQERAMIDASEADAVIDFVGSRGRHPLFDAPYPQRYPIVRALIDRAHHWGLENIQAKGLTFRAALDQVRNKEGR